MTKKELLKQAEKKLTVHDLSTLLHKHPDVCGVQIWQRTDIIGALQEAGYKATEEQIDLVMKNAYNTLSDCSDNWERLQTIISTLPLDNNIITQMPSQRRY